MQVIQFESYLHLQVLLRFFQVEDFYWLVTVWSTRFDADKRSGADAPKQKGNKLDDLQRVEVKTR